MKGGVSQPPSSLDPYVGKFYWYSKEFRNLILGIARVSKEITYHLKSYYYVHKLDEDEDDDNKYLVYEMREKAPHEKINKTNRSVLGRYHYIYAYENQKKFANELTFEETEMFKTIWKKIMENIDNNSFNTIDGQELKDLKTDLQLYGYRNDTENWKKLPWEVNIKSKPNVSKKANVTKKVETGYLYEGKKMTLIEFLEEAKLTTHLRNTNNSTLNQIKELLNEYKNPKNNSKTKENILTELTPIFSDKEIPPKKLLRIAKNLTLISNNSPSPSPSPSPEPKLDDCSLCLEPLNNSNTKNPLITLSCGHTFHTQCIKTIVINALNVTKKQFVCPMCRKKINLNSNSSLVNYQKKRRIRSLLNYKQDNVIRRLTELEKPEYNKKLFNTFLLQLLNILPNNSNEQLLTHAINDYRVT